MKSLYKHLFFSSRLLAQIAITSNQPNHTLVTRSRSSTGIELLEGKNIKIHNGKSYKSLSFKNTMFKFKLGEFSFARKICKGKKKKNKKKNFKK